MNMKKRVGGCFIAGSIIFLLAVRCFFVDLIFVRGNSMYPTLQDKDVVIISKLKNDYKRFDVVVIFSDDGNIVKRIIGVPGDTVQIIDGCVFINGCLLDDEYAAAPMLDAGIAADLIQLDENEYFVLGDNRNNSKDSRSDKIGIIEKRQIVGSVKYSIRWR